MNVKEERQNATPMPLVTTLRDHTTVLVSMVTLEMEYIAQVRHILLVKMVTWSHFPLRN